MTRCLCCTVKWHNANSLRSQGVNCNLSHDSLDTTDYGFDRLGVAKGNSERLIRFVISREQSDYYHQYQDDPDLASERSDSSYCEHHRKQRRRYPEDVFHPAMREPSAEAIVHQRQQPRQQNLTNLSVVQLQEMARRQQQQIETQQHMLVAKEQRLKYLRQQDLRTHQMASEYERLRRLREKVEAQELKLRKLRALRGQNQNSVPGPNAAVLADLESIRNLFNEKEKELSLAVRKVEELTHQLEDLRTGRISNVYPPQVMELERLRRELAYRKQLNEQQNNMIAQQRAQLAKGQDEMINIDKRIMELQDRLAKKRMMNQQLATQISAATTAKQAQLRAIQQGTSKNKNKPVSTVEPFQRQITPEDAEDDIQNKISSKTGNNSNDDANKYQTLPFGSKFNQLNKAQKIEQLKQEKENNNVHFSDNLPPPPPSSTSAGTTGVSSAMNVANNRYMVDHQGNYEDKRSSKQKPVSSVAPVTTLTSSSSSTTSLPKLQRPTELFSTSSLDNYMLSSTANSISKQNNQSSENKDNDSPSNGKPRPALPPKPMVSKNGASTNNQQQQPPPYVPAPPPESSNRNQAYNPDSLDDSSITIRDYNQAIPNGNASLSVTSAPPHPAEEGTSVDDDDSTSAASNIDPEKLANFNSNQNIHVSINRRIEMPPAFLFPEDQAPPSDLISKDVPDNASLFPMMNQIYKHFDHLSPEEKSQLFAKTLEEDDYLHQPVPEFESDHEDDGKPKPPGIIRRTNLKGQENSTSHDKHVQFDPLALLLDASLDGDLELVQRTAREVPDPSASNDEGITALHNAICAGHFSIVKFLVEFGCDVNAQDSDGWTPLHCAASCNNLPMVQFLVEHGACIFATTFSDQETAAEKCEEDEEGFLGCSQYLYSIQEKLGIVNGGKVYALFDHLKANPDEVTFATGDALVVLKKGDEVEKEWWWAKTVQGDEEGYIPRNFFGLYPRVEPHEAPSMTAVNNNSSNMSEDSDSSTSSSSSSSSADKKKSQIDTAAPKADFFEDRGHSSA